MPETHPFISYLDELPFWSAPFGIKLLEKIEPKKNMTVLDIGFGTGFPLIELAMRLGHTCTVYGIDPWKEANDLVRQKLTVYGINNVQLLPVQAQNLAPLQSLQDQSVDLIVSNNGLNNVDDMESMLAECARVLKPGGNLIFTMNLEDTMEEFYEIMKEVLTKHNMAKEIEAMQKHIHDKRKPLDEVVLLLLNSGLNVANADLDKFTYTFTDGTALFHHHFIRMAFYEAWKEIVPEEKHELIFGETEEEINRVSEEKGNFTLTIPYVVIEATKA